jgi:hypothetical protein
MTKVRPQSVPGEKPLFWAGSSKDDLLEFPEDIKDEIGTALSVAQFGGKHPKAKPWKAKARAFWKSSPTTGAILTGPCTR